ncbi:MAG: low temperature requirement protein A [Acidimicrobiia bacterium]
MQQIVDSITAPAYVRNGRLNMLAAFFVLAAAELAVPLWAEAAGRTPWHPRHIAERYGLFTIIVLGESILAATVGVQVALNGETTTGHLVAVVVGGLATVFSMWWLYFDMPAARIVEKVRDTFSERLTGAFAWGYGHYVVFASAAAVGAGLAVAVDQVTHHSRLTDQQAGLAVTVPAAVFLLAVWALHARYKHTGRVRTFAVPVTAALVLVSSVTPQPVLATGVVLAALVVVDVLANRSPARQVA